uniref:Phytocyanin domain-containing protein n=1 Tax=Leersia perrieri TaxID=77586 RepID=A0A0D9WJY4_9ORYZ
MASKTHYAFLLLLAVMASLFAGSDAGVYHIVGAGKGWRMAPNKTYYEEWAETRNISIGDKLMFLYRSGVYNIVEVPTKELFDVCSMKNITNRWQNGPTIIELNQSGPRYYFCGVGKHCEEGQKLAINVSAFAPTPPDAPSSSSATAISAGDLLLLYLAGLAAAMCVASASSLLL